MSNVTPTAEECYRLLVEGVEGYAMILLDTEGRVLSWNAGAERITGWAASEVVGRLIDCIFTPEDRAAGVPDHEMNRARAEGRSLDLRWHMRKDGSRFFADGILEQSWDQAGQERGFAKILRDATEQGERREREQFLAELTERIRRLSDPEEVIADAIRSVGRFLGVERCVFGDIDLVADTCTIIADYCADDSVASIVGTFPFSAFGPFVVAEYQAGRAVAVDDVRLDPLRVTEPNVAAYEAIGIRAHITAPVVHSARLVSVIAVHSSTLRRWKPEEVEMLQIVVERTWLTVEVLRQHRALAREAESTTRILESITDAFFTLDHEWRFTYVNRETERVLFKSREQLLGRYIWEVFPEGEGSTFALEYRRAAAEGVPVAFEEFYPPLNAWLDVRAYPSAGGLLIFFQNVSERKRAEEERERLLEVAKERAEREALLNRVSEAIRATTDPEEIQQVAARALGEALKADRCYFSFYDLAADSNWVGQDFRREDLPSLAGHYRLSAFQVNPEDYYPNERTLVIADALADEWSFPEVLLSTLRQLRVRSALAVPIFDGGRLVATLSVAMADEPRAWTEDEVRVVEIVAAQTRSAVEAALLLAEQQAHLQEEALAGRIGVAIRSEHDPEVIQETAAQLLGEALGVDRCFYLTYDLTRNLATVGPDFRRADLHSLAGEYRLSDFQEMLTEVFAGGTTASISDVRTALSHAIAQAMDPFGHRAVLAVPFFDEGKLVAALWTSMGDTRAWTTHEAALLEQAATLTRTALDMARISRKEHAIAEHLQDALQPALPEHVPGLSVGKFTQPALDEAEIGGDFYDVFPLDKELYAVVIGDVSGKGLAAAQQLALIRNSLRTTLYLYRTPAQAASTLNGIVTAHNLLTGFVTAWVGVYDVRTGRITYASCGHEPGLIRRTAGMVETLETTGPPLGMAENADYTELAVILLPGDSLLLYTDGISEAGPSRRALLGTEGLTRLLGALPVGLDAQVDAEALVDQVNAYAGGVFRDDVAVLFVRRQ